MNATTATWLALFALIHQLIASYQHSNRILGILRVDAGADAGAVAGASTGAGAGVLADAVVDIKQRQFVDIK